MKRTLWLISWLLLGPALVWAYVTLQSYSVGEKLTSTKLNANQSALNTGLDNLQTEMKDSIAVLKSAVDTVTAKRFLVSINGSANDAIFAPTTSKNSGIYFAPSTTGGYKANSMHFTSNGGEYLLVDSLGVSITAKGTKVATFDSTGINVTGNIVASGYVSDFKNIYQITAANDTFYSSGNYKSTGSVFYATPLAQKSTLLLESAVIGANLEVYASDSDSLRITTATGDSIYVAPGTAYKTMAITTGSVKLVAIDDTRWIMLFTKNTWTYY